MRILMLIDALGIGGAETHVVTLARALAAGGDLVTVVSAGGEYVGNLLSAGVRHRTLPLRERAARKIPALIRELRRIAKEERADICHAHTRGTAALATFAFRGRLPVVSTAHLIFPAHPLFRKNFWGWGMLAVSEDIRAVYAGQKAAHGRTRVTKNGIDESEFPATFPRGRAILHVSRLDEGRSAAAFALCEIAPALLSTFPDLSLRIAGDGDLFAEVSHAAEIANEKLGRQGVELVGKCTKIAGFLNTGCLFVGVSRAALEAMSVGLPVLLAGDEGYGGILDARSFPKMRMSNLCARGEEKIDPAKLLFDLETLLSSEAARESCAHFSALAVRRFYSAASMAEDARALYRDALTAHDTVALLGYFGHGNLGDEAALSALRLAWRDLPCSLPTLSPFSLRLPGRRCRAVVSAGGTLLQNETSRRSLFVYLSSIRRAARRVPVHLLSSGIGGIKGERSRHATRRTLTSLSSASFRTPADLSLYRVLADERAPEGVLSPDLCFLFPPIRMQKRERVAVILSRRGGLSSRLSALLSSLSLAPVFLVFFPAEDLALAKKTAEAYGSAPLLPKDAHEAMRALAPCRLTLTDRLHGAILSLLAGTPAILTDDSFKKTAFLSYAAEDAAETPVRALSDFDGKSGEIKQFYDKNYDFSAFCEKRKAEVKVRLSSLPKEIFD